MRTVRLLGRGLVTVVLFAVLGGAAALVLAPGLLAPVEGALEPGYGLIEEFETRRLLLIGALLLGGVATLLVAIRKLSGGEPTPRLVAEDQRPPEAVSVDPATVSGDAADRAIADVASLDDARELREELRETAVGALRAAGESPEQARERLERGDWTDDDLAAGFLGETVPVPLLARLRGWLDESAEGRRRLIRSVDAVAALADGTERTIDTATEGTDE